MAQRERVPFAWHPTWSREVEGWTIKQIKKNLWRFDRSEDVHDIMQDARLLWVTLEKKYPIVNESQHFFALYKTSLSRMFIDKARVQQKSVIDTNTHAEDVAENMQLQGTPNYGYFNVLLEEMPDELKLVLRALTSGRVRLKLDRPTKSLQLRENLNMRLKRRFPNLTTSDPVGDLQRILKYNT